MVCFAPEDGMPSLKSLPDEILMFRSVDDIAQGGNHGRYKTENR